MEFKIVYIVYHPKGLAFIVALATALATTVIVWLLTGSTGVRLPLTVFFVTLVAGFMVIYYALEILFFREVRKLEKHLRSFDHHDEVRTLRKSHSGNPLRAVSEKLEMVVRAKQEEIDRLRKLEVFRKDFIADVSHELKTPIFAAQGFVHTLLDGAVKEKTVRNKFLKKAARSLDGLDMLVQDLLTLSHIETGQIKMRFETFDLYSLTEEVFEQFKGETNKKEIILRIEGNVRKVLAYGDPVRIGQVMTNLISNAIKHSPDEGEVIVRFTVRKKSIVTQVQDFGEGIADEHVNRIFERFYRVDKSRSREKGGTGLGLAIVKHILDGHHAKAEVESSPGKGSTFRFKLPRKKKEESGISESTES